jgi:hypothetical protein
MAYERSNEPEDDELARIKQSLKAGTVSPDDLQVLKNLVERTERAATQLRAALIE